MSGFHPSVCIDAVFEGKSFEDACRAVSEAGLPAIEFWGWWDKDLEALQEAREKYDLALSACCTKFVSLVDPETRAAYLEGLAASIETARSLGTRTLISQVGDFRPGVPREAQRITVHARSAAGWRTPLPALRTGSVCRHEWD